MTRIVGLLSWWDESPTWLAATVASVSRACDHLVALDGRYAQYQDDRIQSPIEQAEAIVDAARATGMGLTLHTAPRTWATEMDKRTYLFRIGALEAREFEDYFLVIDGDETLHRWADWMPDEVERMASERINVGVARMIETLDTHESPAREHMSRSMDLEYVFQNNSPRLWRCLRDMRVTNYHYHYSGVDESGKRVSLWGQQRVAPDGRSLIMQDEYELQELTPWRHFADHEFQIENRNQRRSKRRDQSRQAYYAERDKSGVEVPSVPACLEQQGMEAVNEREHRADDEAGARSEGACAAG